MILTNVIPFVCFVYVHRLFHTAPSVPHYTKNKAVGVIKAGHSFTIEPMISEGMLFHTNLICNNGTVEDEEHFLFHCNFYYGEQQDFYNYMKNNIPNFNNLSIEQKLQIVMTKEYVQIFSKRYGKFTKRDRTNYLFNYYKLRPPLRLTYVL